jgi:DNA invertase Pin-like site-specific DNA recombinase
MSPRRRKHPQKKDQARAVAYLRVSTEDQALGPEAQRAAIENWAARQGVQVLSWHIDQGVGGATPIEDRPGLLAALRDLEDLECGLVVVAKWDRLARDIMVAAMVERMVERVGARIVSADGVGVGDGPEAALMRAMVQAFAAYERALIRARTSAALRALRAKGQRAGEVPLGYRLAEDGKGLLEDAGEAEAIDQARRLRADGWSYRRIASEMERRGLQPRGAKWHAMTVSRMAATQRIHRPSRPCDALITNQLDPRGPR